MREAFTRRIEISYRVSNSGSASYDFEEYDTLGEALERARVLVAEQSVRSVEIRRVEQEVSPFPS